ncbi:MAG TPA: nickel pincer cofactor biosynthesis protein LarC [Acidimicrobiales bacterium]|nr:nickel pincer cofactor biosynthesis protein LarC [Acidimicrobiales bacterium]
MTTAWFHCFSGIAGDMALGALVDAGADLDEVRALCERLPVPGWELTAEPVLRCGIAGTKVHVQAEETSVVRTAGHITALVEEARLPDRVRTRALAVFHRLAEAEGRLHRKPASQVHFHEVGGIDAIVDVVGTCAALELLDIDEVWSSPVTHGIGMVRAAHGLLPNPAPAVVELLRDAPVRGIEVPFELTTPTGAALVATLATGWGPLPPLTIRATGFGAGSREIDGRPNLLQVVIGDPAGDGALVDGQPVVLLEANVDDATGEVLAHAVAALLEAGAHDAWITPILMKKGRPAHTVSALADVALARQISSVLTAETGSLGVRGQRLERWPETRAIDEVDVDGAPIRVKVSPGRVKAEFDDAARAATRSGRPVREVLSDAESAWRARTHTHGHDHSHDEGPADPAS